MPSSSTWPIVCARSRVMNTTTPTPRPAAVPIASTLADLAKFCRSRPLWLIRSTLADRFHFGRSGPLWSIRSTLTDQVHFGRSVQLWLTRSTLAVFETQPPRCRLFVLQLRGVQWICVQPINVRYMPQDLQIDVTKEETPYKNPTLPIPP